MPKKFERPYFITPHAVERFQQKIANYPAHAVMEIIMQALQNPRTVEGVHGVYLGGRINGKLFYIPVTTSVYPEKGDWPVVPTILDENSSLHRKVMAMRRKRYEEAQKGNHPGDSETSG